MSNCFTQYISPIRGLWKQYIMRAPRYIITNLLLRRELPVCELIDLTRGIVSAAFSRRRYHRQKPHCEIVVSFLRIWYITARWWRNYITAFTTITGRFRLRVIKLRLEWVCLILGNWTACTNIDFGRADTFRPPRIYICRWGPGP